MVSKNQGPLLSTNQNLSDRSRYDLLAFVLGEHYQLKIPLYNERPSAILKSDDSILFLDRTLERVCYEKIGSANLQNQANMWVEGVYRSYAAAWEMNPTMKDGVYLPENQSIAGLVFIPRRGFVRLQSHSQ